MGEQAVLSESPKATIIRPSLVFGPGDGFFAVSFRFFLILFFISLSFAEDADDLCSLNAQRFATLAKFLPFLPVFGGGTSLFQPVRCFLTGCLT